MPGPVTSHCHPPESTPPVAATDGARMEDAEAVALETKEERLFISVSKGLQSEGAGVVPLWSSLYQELPRKQVQHS